MEKKMRNSLVLTPPPRNTRTHAYIHIYIHNILGRTLSRPRGWRKPLSVSSLPPHDTDDQDRARAIRTRRWRRQLFCGTNRARAPQPWRTYSTPSWDCHPRRVLRVLVREDPSWPPRPPSVIAIRTPSSARRKPGRAAATYAKTSKVGGLCKFSFWSADPTRDDSISSYGALFFVPRRANACASSVSWGSILRRWSSCRDKILIFFSFSCRDICFSLKFFAENYFISGILSF